MKVTRTLSGHMIPFSQLFDTWFRPGTGTILTEYVKIFQQFSFLFCFLGGFLLFFWFGFLYTTSNLHQVFWILKIID